MAKPGELLLFDFLTDSVSSSAPGSTLYSAIVHDTIYQSIGKADRVIRISDAVSEFAPGPGMVMEEFDVQVTIVVASRVTGKEKTQRQDALTDVFELQAAVCSLILGDPTLGGRTCETVLERSWRSYDTLDGEPFAVANIPVVVNASGKRLGQ